MKLPALHLWPPCSGPGLNREGGGGGGNTEEKGTVRHAQWLHTSHAGRLATMPTAASRNPRRSAHSDAARHKAVNHHRQHQVKEAQDGTGRSAGRTHQPDVQAEGHTRPFCVPVTSCRACAAPRSIMTAARCGAGDTWQPLRRCWCAEGWQGH